MSTFIVLNTAELEKGLPGVSPAMGSAHAEACIVCLDAENHASGVQLLVNGDLGAKTCQVQWDRRVTEQMQATWNDQQVATEQAACGIAFLLILKLTEYTVIKRSRKGTGYDYQLGFRDAELPFQNTARLEVSGIQKMRTRNDIDTRVQKKLKQTKQSDGLSQGDAYIVVVEFSAPTSHIAVRHE